MPLRLAPSVEPHPQRDGPPLYMNPQPDVELHVMRSVECAGDSWWAECGCGWVSDPQPTRQAATSLKCGVDDADLQGHHNRFLRNRKRFEDAEFDRAFPSVTPQV